MTEREKGLIKDISLKLYHQLIKTNSRGAELNLKNGDKLIVQLVRPIQHLNIINNTGGKDNDKFKENKDR